MLCFLHHETQALDWRARISDDSDRLTGAEKSALFGDALAEWRSDGRRDRGSSLLRPLLAEHHVYVRSGETSRYVVLRWPWRAGVTLALVAVAGWIGLASFGWLAAHLETLDLRRELAEVYQRLEAPATGHAGAPAGATAATRLIAELEAVKGGREGGTRRSEPDAAAAGELRAGPAAAGELAARLLPAPMPTSASGAGRDWLYDRIARAWADGLAGGAETIRLRAELRAARAEIARLASALGPARGETGR